MGISLNIPDPVILKHQINLNIIIKDPSKLEEWSIKYESENFKSKKDGTWKWITRLSTYSPILYLEEFFL